MLLSQLLLIGMGLLIFANVFMRYVLNSGIFWAEEVSLVMAVWFIFIGLALGIRKNLHISIHILRNPPEWLDRGLYIVRDLAAILLGYVILRCGWVLIQFTSTSIMPATELPSSVLYAILPLSAILILYEAGTDLIGISTDEEGEGA
jgi:TRAP-type C4-dicarboxylate transport system permease small subunit